MPSASRFLLLAGFAAVLITPDIAAQESVPHKAYIPLIVRSTSQTGVSSSLSVAAATHLGGTQNDTGSAVDVAPDGSIVFGGTLPNYTPPGSVTTLLNGTSGIVLRLRSDGQQVISATRIGGSVSDLEVSADGATAVCGDFGVGMLNSSASALKWHASSESARRCSVGTDGTVAALIGGEAVVYDADGSTLGRWAVDGSAQNDIAVDGQHSQVIVTGFNQVSNNLQNPFIRAYTYNGTLRWRSYDFPAGTPNLGTADTRGERVAIGRDGKLYFTGSINGSTGASIFVRDPKDTSTSANDRIVVTDKYTNPFNIGSVKMLWFGRFNPQDGQLELAQSLLTRRSDDKGNSIGAHAITADTDGTVYLAGGASAFIADRSQSTVSGVRAGPYGGSDPYVLVISPDFKQRRIWVTFIGPEGGNGNATAVAVRGGVAALAGTVNSGRFITYNALQADPAGASDGYLAVWQK